MQQSQIQSGVKVTIRSRHVVGWYLFAVAGSVLVFNGGLYFPQWLVVDNHVGDLWYNLSLFVTTAILLISAPALGLLSDRRYGRLIFLRITSAVMFLGCVMLFVADHYIVSHWFRVVGALVAFVAVMYSYQLSLVFHNALLARVSPVETYATISGRCIAWELIGAVVGIVAVLPFVDGIVPYVHAGRGQAFLPSAILFAALVVPSLMLMPDDAIVTSEVVTKSLKGLYHSLWQDLRSIPKQRQLYVFLLGYLVYSDVVLTIENNASLYLEKVMGFSDSAKAALYLLLLLGAAVGAAATAYVLRWVSHAKLLMCVLGGWLVALVVVTFSNSVVTFFVVFFVVGLLFGALLNLARVIYILLLPSTRRGELFGVYASFERSASLLGPLVWSVPIVLLPRLGAGRYRVAMSLMAVLIVVSMLFVARLGRISTSGSGAGQEEGPGEAGTGFGANEDSVAGGS